MRILVTGASGSGSSTLGRAVAATLRATFVDADDLFWLPSDPPFKAKREAAERAKLLREQLSSAYPVVVSGSLYGWGAELEDAFDLVVFLRAPAEVRVDRLRARELQRFGRVDEEFIAWAAQYDIGAMPGRSLARHLRWLELRTCPVLRLSGTESVEALRSAVLAALVAEPSCRKLTSVEETHRASAEWLRSLISDASATPTVVRAALMAVPPTERDAWTDLVLGIDSVPGDGPELPRGCVPYLPCPVDALLRMVEQAGVQESDVFVDVGSGVGRAAALVHLLTGATTIGIEIQPALVRAAHALRARLNAERFSSIGGDAAQLAGLIDTASIFFLYCPFSGARLEKVLGDIEPIARTRSVRVCCVDLPIPPRPWLKLVSPPDEDLAVYRSTLLDSSLGQI